VLVHLLKCTGPIKGSLAQLTTVDSWALSRGACSSALVGRWLISIGIVSVPAVLRVVHGWREKRGYVVVKRWDVG